MGSRQHILIVTSSFPDGVPGSEAAGSFVEDFVGTLAGEVDVTVLAPGIRASHEYKGNISIHRFAVPYLPLSLLTLKNPAHWLWIMHTLRTGQDALRRLVNEKRVDHILALWAFPSGYWARNVWKKYGVPYSTWALGSDIWTFKKLPLVNRILATVLRNSHTCFADGYQLKKDVEAISGRSCEFLASSRNLPVVEKKRLSTVPAYRLAFLGRFHPNKGVDLMLDSLNLLSDDEWDKIKEVRICGGGPLEERVRSGCDSLKKKGRPVIAEGYLNKAQAAELLTWTDYLLIPSRIESIPVVYSDAMQAGCPVIAMPVGDLPMLMRENEVGTLADDVTPEAFARAMRAALAVPPERFSPGLKEACKMFDVHRTASRLLDSILTSENHACISPINVIDH